MNQAAVSGEQAIVLGILAAALVLFVWGRWRYDLVAFMALMAAVVLGMVPFENAFTGFGHPATVTVALVLILSRALAKSGATEFLARPVMRATATTTLHVGALAGTGALLSTLMNNVGALALMLPVAMQSAAKAERSPSLLLMPLSFGAILGGLVTVIGTPPNIIIATYRGSHTGAPFRMFDFTPVGGVVALTGIAFVALLGWRLMPRRAQAGAGAIFQIDDYVAEARVVEGSAAAGKTLGELEAATGEIDAAIIGVVRDQHRLPAVSPYQRLQRGDLLVIEAAPEELARFVAELGLEFAETAGDTADAAAVLRADHAEVVEAVVAPRTAVEGWTIGALQLRRRFGVNLLAASRQGQSYRGRLRSFRLRAGDVLLLQGEPDRLSGLFVALGWLPLASRGVQIGQGRRAGLAAGLFAAAIAAATFGLLPLQIAFGLAVVAMIICGLIATRELYDAIDWSVVVLLGSMIPVGHALETSGATELIARTMVGLVAGAPAFVIVAAIMLVTMTLTDILNNAATAVIMTPIASGLAVQLGAPADAFLMAVAVGASCAFLTPIGHQNNTLVMGPGGYTFGDYWRMGLPLEILIVLVATPMILLVWS